MVYNNNMNQIVETMVEQINRRPEGEPLRLFTSLGASLMVHGDDFIQFKVKGDRDVNKVKVIYDEGQDLYNIEFSQVTFVFFLSVVTKFDFCFLFLKLALKTADY